MEDPSIGNRINLYGTVYGNHWYNGYRVIPATFDVFDRIYQVGVSSWGPVFEFGKFIPTREFQTKKSAFDWLEINWVRR